MKTREEEITKEAKKFAKEIDDWEIAEDVQDAFEAGAKWADAHPRWISVEEKLPKGGFAIITNGDDVLVGKYNFEKGLWGVRNKTMFAYTLLPANWKVTHWMPLPPPHHIIDTNKMVDRVVGTPEHIQTALDVMKKGGEG